MYVATARNVLLHVLHLSLLVAFSGGVEAASTEARPPKKGIAGCDYKEEWADIRERQMDEKMAEAREKKQLGELADLVQAEVDRWDAESLSGRRPELVPEEPAGIIMCAGGATHLTQAFLSLHIIRTVHNCTLPIDLVFAGAREMPVPTRKLFQVSHTRSAQCANH